MRKVQSESHKQPATHSTLSRAERGRADQHIAQNRLFQSEQDGDATYIVRTESEI